MKTEENESIKNVKFEKYDGRKGYEFIPAILIVVMTLGKVIAFLSPYYAATFLADTNVGLILSIQSDDTYNMMLATLVGYFIRQEKSKKII